jgi:hypothetical protein
MHTHQDPRGESYASLSPHPFSNLHFLHATQKQQTVGIGDSCCGRSNRGQGGAFRTHAIALRYAVPPNVNLHKPRKFRGASSDPDIPDLTSPATNRLVATDKHSNYDLIVRHSSKLTWISVVPQTIVCNFSGLNQLTRLVKGRQMGQCC